MTSRRKSPSLRVPEELINLAEYFSAEQHADRSTIFRQWIHDGAERMALRAVSDGQLSLGRAVELLGITHWEVYDLVHKHGIEIGATEIQVRESLLKHGSLLDRSLRGVGDNKSQQDNLDS